jgi:glutathione synthase/RimK-type ligase-like ATP-grasp enzyme
MAPFLDYLKQTKTIKKMRKMKLYSRFRQHFPQPEYYLDDRGRFSDAEKVLIDWPKERQKPHIGVVRDPGPYPRWTKYCRFLDNNSFEYDIFSLHSHDWIEKANQLDIIVGMCSSEHNRLLETREKYHFLETYLGKTCYPSAAHVMLYENKRLETYISWAKNIPFAKTMISHDKQDALLSLDKLSYPLISKIDPSSGSFGVDFVRSKNKARKIVKKAFSGIGRQTHLPYNKQKNYVLFQEFIPNDGYDIRVIVVGNLIFGYYRKVLDGDFRASGMNLVEKRELPGEAMKIALMVNNIIKSPMLVVDMLHGLDDKYYIIELSPFCQMETPAQLHVRGVPGVYVFEDGGSFHFEKGRYWVAELALREFLLSDYIPNSG